MNNYEGVFVVDPELKEDEQGKMENSIKDAIAKQKGVVETVEKWGKRRLAYRIRKKREGFYYLVNFKAAPETVATLEKAYRLNESILKLMFIKK